MINVKLFTAPSSIRANIQQSGRLGFTLDAIDFLELRKKYCIGLGKNEVDLNDPNLYMNIYDRFVPNTFNINSSGHYVYLNAKSYFKFLKYDYENIHISFNIIELEKIEGGKQYKLEKWEYFR